MIIFTFGVFCTVFFILLTRKGKNVLVTVAFGKIVKDYGDIGSSTLRGFMTQTLHLYKCINDKENFFVLEIRVFNNIQYAKISLETVQNFIKVVSSENQN